MSEELDQSREGRRSFLKYAGAASAASITGLAGCIGGGDDEDSGNGNGNGGGNGNGNDSGNGGGDDLQGVFEDDIRYIIPFSEGGGTDTYARQMVPLIDERLDVNIAIENISGAASLRGTGEMMFSEPDGHTLAAFNPPSTPVSEMVNPQDFNLEEVTGVAAYARTPFVIVANPDYGIEDFDDLLSRYEEGELEIFSGKERGGVDHVLALLMQNRYDFQWGRYVGYDGSGPAVQATIQDEVPAAISTDTAAESAVESGDVDPVVCLSSEGTDVFPDLETVTDAGYDNIDFLAQLRRGIYAPPGTAENEEAAQRLQRFQNVVEEVLQLDEMQEWSEQTGNVIEFGTGEDAAAAVQEAYEQVPENVDLEQVREEAN